MKWKSSRERPLTDVFQTSSKTNIAPHATRTVSSSCGYCLRAAYSMMTNSTNCVAAEGRPSVLSSHLLGRLAPEVTLPRGIGAWPMLSGAGMSRKIVCSGCVSMWSCIWATTLPLDSPKLQHVRHFGTQQTPGPPAAHQGCLDAAAAAGCTDAAIVQRMRKGIYNKQHTSAASGATLPLMPAACGLLPGLLRQNVVRKVPTTVRWQTQRGRECVTAVTHAGLLSVC